MKINNIQSQRNQRQNFKAGLNIEIGKTYCGFLRGLKEHDTSLMANSAQDAIDAVELLRKVAPIIGDDSNVLSLKACNAFAQDGGLELTYSAKGEWAESGLLFPRDNMESSIRQFINRITNGVLGDDDISPSRRGYWTPFYSGSQISEKVSRSLHDYNRCGLIREEAVTPDEMIERVMQLDTVW